MSNADVILSNLRKMLAEDVELYDLCMKDSAKNFRFDNAEVFRVRKNCAKVYLNIIEKELK